MANCRGGSSVDTQGDLAIQAWALKKEFGDVAAVRGLDLKVRRGSTFGLLGPNGAGKSTTIRMLMGLIAPTEGEATVLGNNVRTETLAIRAQVGYVPEHHYIYRWMTVREVINFTSSFYPTWNDTVCHHLIQHYDLNTNKKVKELSHGMVTKLALLLALSHEPELLILDEPTTGLDPLVREEFLDRVVHLLAEKRRTVLFSSHIMSDIDKVADTIGIINEGKLLISCPRAELLQKTKRLNIGLKENHGTVVSPEGTVWERVDGRQWSLTVHGFSHDTIEELRQKNDVEHSEVVDVGLEDIFKDFIKGQRQDR